MKNYSCILAFGDSLLAGAELDGKFSEYMHLIGMNKMSIKQMDNLTKHLAFPQLLANQLNIPCHNFAMSGGSNERSLRLLIKHIQNYENPLILFGYTAHIRKEYYYPPSNNSLIKDEDSFAQVGSIVSFWHGQENGKAIRSHNNLNSLYLKHFLHEYDNLTEIAMCVEGIVKYFSHDVIHLPLMKFKSISDLSKRLPHMCVYDFEGKKSFESWYSLKGFKILEFGHPDQKAHVELSEKLYKYLDKIHDTIPSKFVDSSQNSL